MTRVLLTGDSWGIGVFELNPVTGYGPTGKGIATILPQHGIGVTNISKAGGSNWLMIDRMNGDWNNQDRCSFGALPYEKVGFDFSTIDYIVHLQTDVFRERYTYIKEFDHSTTLDKKWLDGSFIESLLQFDSIQKFIDHYFAIMYAALNEIGVKHGKKILCVGGWSKLHPSITNFSNLVPVIESATKFLIPELGEDTYLSDPEWFVQLGDDSRAVKKFGNELKRMTIAVSDKFDTVINNWREVHPPIQGYEKIVSKLLPHLVK